MKRTTILAGIFASCLGSATQASSPIEPTVANPDTAQSAPANTTLTPATVDCNYQVPKETTHLDVNTIKKWAEYASLASFHFTYNTIDDNMRRLKNCFTPEGYQSFQTALQKSGNLTVIQTQKLSVDAAKTGEASIAVLPDNQWRITLPIDVIYHNQTNTITQHLKVTLLIAQQNSGKLGIIQINAVEAASDNTTKTETTPPTASNTPAPESTPAEDLHNAPSPGRPTQNTNTPVQPAAPPPVH